MDPPKSAKKFRSIKPKKRKGFPGKNRWEVAEKLRETVVNSESSPEISHLDSPVIETEGSIASDSKTSTPLNNKKPAQKPRNISEEKLMNSSFGKLEQEEGKFTRSSARRLGFMRRKEVTKAHGIKLQDVSLLSESILTAAICSSCRKPDSKLHLFQDDGQRNGLAEKLFLLCNICDHKTMLDTSKQTGGKGGGAFEVNRRSVLASTSTGLAGLSKFCATMNLPPPVTKKAYNEHLKLIEKEGIENAEKLMCEAAKRLKAITAAKTPEKMHKLEDGSLVADVSVTVDGTWQKRGHSSKHGVVFVLSVVTGEVLDYGVKSLQCQECTAHEKWDKDSIKYTKWKKTHASICPINHNGSSEAMEADGAVDIFQRSIEKRGLRYTLFVGDGDSSCYGNVKEAVKDKYEVTKEECVGHVQKRMGTAIRKYRTDMKGRKLSDGKGVGGRGRLTEKQADKIQNYYGEAIRHNPGNKEGMKKAIWAIYHHKIDGGSIPLKEQHKFCPKDKDTWCEYWKDKNAGTNEYDNEARLPEVFRAELKPIFDRLSSDNLLDRCLLGLTQNQNEAINGQLWLNCPKNKFCGKRKIVIAVCETVGVFNTGAASKGVMLKSCGVSPGQNTMKALRKLDDQRLQNASYKISDKYKKRRRELRTMKKSKADKKSYGAGKFDLSSKPEKKKKKTKQAAKSQKPKTKQKQKLVYSTCADVGITFAVPISEVTFVPPKKARLS